MRPQLFAGGILTILLGALIYLTGFFSDIGVVFVGGGAVMGVASFFLDEGGLPIQPPEGYRFCIFCSAPVPLADSRCSKCNGLQPKEGG